MHFLGIVPYDVADVRELRELKYYEWFWSYIDETKVGQFRPILEYQYLKHKIHINSVNSFSVQHYFGTSTPYIKHRTLTLSRTDNLPPYFYGGGAIRPT